MRILRGWKALAFLGSTFGLLSMLLLALARPVGGRVATAAPSFVRPVSTVRTGDEETASFSVRVKGESIPYRVFGLFVMPGERVLLEIAKEAPARSK